jgi:hypothetical protein
MQRDERERHRIPLLQHHALEFYIGQFAPRQNTPRITRLANSRLYEWGKVPAAPELVLDAEAALCTKFAGPLRVDLSLEIECSALVGEVAWHDEEDEGDPKKECVDGQEGPVIEDDAGPADERGNDAKCGRQGGDNKLWSVAYTYDVCVLPYVEPCQKGKDECC